MKLLENIKYLADEEIDNIKINLNQYVMFLILKIWINQEGVMSQEFI